MKIDSTMIFDKFSISSSLIIWMSLSLILAIVGGILIYYLFLTKENEKNLKGFGKQIYEFLNFKKFYSDILLKIIYIMSAIYISLISFMFLPYDFFLFLFTLILGNILLRITFEFISAIFKICKKFAGIK